MNWAAWGVVGCLVYWMFRFLQRSFGAVTAEKAIAVLLESGASVEYRGWHIYRSANTYCILNFNEKGDAYLESEEEFNDIGDAVSKFIYRSKM